MSIPDDHAVKTMLTQLKSIKVLQDKKQKKRIQKAKKEAEEDIKKYGTFLIQTDQKVEDNVKNDWDFSESHSIDEVGYDQIDEFHDMLRARNGKGKFKEDFFDVKDQLIAIIDSLKKEIEQTMEQRLIDELHSNIAASDYLDFLHREIKWLDYQIEEALKPKGKSLEIIKELEAYSHQCHENLDKMVDYLHLLRRKIDLYSNNREAYRARLQKEAEIIKFILDIYRKALGDISDDFQERIDDGLEDRSYPQTSHHHNRQLTQQYAHRIDSLQKEIEHKTKKIVAKSR